MLLCLVFEEELVWESGSVVAVGAPLEITVALIVRWTLSLPAEIPSLQNMVSCLNFVSSAAVQFLYRSEKGRGLLVEFV